MGTLHTDSKVCSFLFIGEKAAMATYVLACLLPSLVSEAPDCPAKSPVALENELKGSPSTEWDINGAGDPTIQGFATEMSIAAG